MTTSPVEYQGIVLAQAGFEVACYSLQLTLKTIGYLEDDDGRDGWEFVQFCGRTAAQGVMQGCRLNEEPVSKEFMIVGALLGDLFLNLGVGLTRHGIAYTKAAHSRSSVAKLELPTAQAVSA